MTTSGVSGDDYLTGSDGSDKLVGGGGSDTIDGGAGSDFINAGGGDDVILYDEADYKILGGGGYDALWFTGSHQQLDLGSQAVKGIEALWLGGDGGHDVWFSADDVVRISDNDRFVITGDASSRLHIGSGWSFQGLSDDGQSQLLTNGLASLMVELPVFVEGFSNNATITFADGADTAVTEDEATGLLKASGQLIVDDPNAAQGLLPAALLGMPLSGNGTLGSLTVNLVTPDSASAPGVYDYRYHVDNEAVQSLGAGVVRNETFTLTTIDGTTRTLTFTVTGVNDAAVVTVPENLSVTEDVAVDGNGDLTASGMLGITDPDAGEAGFRTTVVSASDNIGELLLQTDGQFAYKVSNAAVQFLGADQTKDELFTVTTIDGGSVDLKITIIGTNDGPTVLPGGTTTANVSELAFDDPEANSSTPRTVTGSFEVRDPDPGDTLVPSTGSNLLAGPLGTTLSFAIGDADDSGVRTIDWTYTYTDAALNSLPAGPASPAEFTIRLKDSNDAEISQLISVGLTGTNDPAHIMVTGPLSVTEDTNVQDNQLITTGIISITDPDLGEAELIVAPRDEGANIGDLLISKQGPGSYVFAYAVNNNDPRVQALEPGQYFNDQFILLSTDNTQRSIDIIINGKNSESISGTAGDDYLLGTSGAESIYGLAGDDEIDGDSGNDFLDGGQGNDTLDGGPGNDTVRGGEGNDTVRGGAGSDVLYGDGGDDFIVDDRGFDTVIAYGGSGDDVIDITAFDATIDGGDGNDVIYVDHDTRGTIYGGPGSDTFIFRYAGTTNFIIYDFDISKPPSEGGDIIRTPIPLNEISFEEAYSFDGKTFFYLNDPEYKFTLFASEGFNVDMAQNYITAGHFEYFPF